MTRTVEEITNELDSRTYLPDGSLFYDTEHGRVHISIDTIASNPRITFHAANFLTSERRDFSTLSDAMQYIYASETN